MAQGSSLDMTLMIARRPVFDGREKLFAYDLAVCAAADSAGIHHDVQPEQLLAEVFLETGIKSVAGDHPVFVTASRDLLVGGTFRVLPADRVILQVPTVATSDAELVAACNDLAAGGYRLAIEIGEETPIDTPLRSVHLARVDVMAMSPPRLSALTARLREFPLRLLATNVLHSGERDRCAALGFDLFEGYRFSGPEVLSRREVSVEHLQAFRVLKLLRDPKSDDREIEELIGRDVGLSYKLLRMVNSSAIGGRDIWSIGHALRVLGRSQVARWVSVLLVTDTGTTGVRAELTHLALVRARMCERLAEPVGVPKAAGSLFLVGLLSVLDQLLEVPMRVLCDSMDLAPDLRNALVDRSEFFGAVLRLVESYVAGQWTDVDSLARSFGIEPPALHPVYLDALQWATSHRPGDDD